MQEDYVYDILYKLVIVGDSGVGKSNLLFAIFFFFAFYFPL